MKDFFEKSILVGLGVYAKTDREIRKAIASFVKNKKLSKVEGEKLVADLLSDAKKLERKIEEYARRASVDVIRELKVATQKDLALLEEKLKKLKR